jgi:hypothetical protein
MVDGVHLVHAVQPLRILVDVLLRVEDGVVAFHGMVEILLQYLVGHARALAGGAATVVDAVEMEVDADAVGKRVLGIVGCRQRHPPDRRKIGGDQGHQGDQGQDRDQSILLFLVLHDVLDVGGGCVRLRSALRRSAEAANRYYFFLAGALAAPALHIEPGMVRLA